MSPQPTVGEAIWQIVLHPRQCLIERWNWKSALFSSLLRALIFFTTNLAYGWEAAAGAMRAEFLYRSATAGFYGAATQKMASARPHWLASLVTLVGVPLISHLVEAAIHYFRHTPNLSASIRVSVAFTCLSTLFNLHAMRRGTLVVGEHGRTIWADLAAIPRLIVSFVLAGPEAIARCARKFQVPPA